MGIRKDLAAQLRTILPATWGVQEHPAAPRAIDPDLAALVILDLTDIRPGEETGSHSHSIDVWLVSPVTATDDGQAEDALDALLELLLETIDGPQLPWLDWSAGERATVAGVWPAWKISTTVPTITTEETTP